MMRIKALLSLAALFCPLAMAQVLPSECKWKIKNGFQFWHCKVDLTVLPNRKLRISREPFEVPPGIPVKLVWRLAPSQFHFRDGDGILLKNSSGQFSSPCATNTDDGECLTVAKPRRFKWFISNTGPFDETYCIAFHDNDGGLHTYDPTIVNSFVFELDRGVKSTRQGVNVQADIPPSSCDGFASKR